MSEAYFLSSAIALSPAQALQAALASGGARPAWVEEIYLLRASRSTLDPGLPQGCPVSAWKNEPGLDAFVLQSACRQLVLKERRMVALVQQARLLLMEHL